MKRETWMERNAELIAVAVALFIVIGIPVIWQFWLAPTVLEQNAQAGQDIAEDTMSSENAMEEYRWFRTQWYEIQAQSEQTNNYQNELERFYEIQGEDPDEWSSQAEVRHGRIQERITGSQNQERSLISEYNARQDDATSAIFQCGLPQRVDKKLFISDGMGVEYTSDEARDRTPPEDPSSCKFSGDPEDAAE